MKVSSDCKRNRSLQICKQQSEIGVPGEKKRKKKRERTGGMGYIYGRLALDFGGAQALGSVDNDMLDVFTHIVAIRNQLRQR